MKRRGLKISIPDYKYKAARPSFESISHITDGIYVGNINSVTKEYLNAFKIGAVVSIQTVPVNIGVDVPVLRVSVEDSFGESLESLFDPVIEFIHHHIKRKRRVLVHCTAGVSRSPSFVIAYLVRYMNMDVDTAIKAVKTKRSCSSPNASFLTQLDLWSKKSPPKTPPVYKRRRH